MLAIRNNVGLNNLISFKKHSTDTTYYAVKDHLNSVIALVNESGSIVESYSYDSFGRTQIFGPDGVERPRSYMGNRYMFQGREYDAETDLYYFRARWYDSETGRWLSKDPIGIEGGLNQYVAFSNNPVNFVDPMGEAGWLLYTLIFALRFWPARPLNPDDLYDPTPRPPKPE